MDPIRNPYAPGAGSRPPELAGRDELIEDARVAIGRIRAGKAAKSLIMVGLRGVGKTVLLDRIRRDAEATGVVAVRLEAPEDRSLPGMLAPELRLALLKLSGYEKAKDLATRALRGLTGFVKGLRVAFNDIEVGLSYEAEPGLADNGNLENDLPSLMVAAGQAAAAADTALVIFIDELQYVEERQLAALITAMHRCAQEQLPVTIVAAGLPQLRAQTGEAKSYAERLFRFPEVGALQEDDARAAIEKPAEAEGVAYTEDALRAIRTHTQGYPYFLQEWGKHAWNAAVQSPITAADVESATTTAIAELDSSFFRMRFDRLTPSEKRYVRAMAELGEGPHRSGEIAAKLDREVTSLGPTRASLIKKGMVWSPTHGDTAFTVPLFHEYMCRVMPGDGWRSA